MALCDYHTPEGSEVDELEYANFVADQLFFLSRTQQVKEHHYRRCATWLDTVPGAGQYFRCLSMKAFSDEQWAAWGWYGEWQKEQVAQREQSREKGWQAKQWTKPKGKGSGRVKVVWH